MKTDGDWPAVLSHTDQLGPSVETPAREPGLSRTTVRYSGQGEADNSNLYAGGRGEYAGNQRPGLGRLLRCRPVRLVWPSAAGRLRS